MAVCNRVILDKIKSESRLPDQGLEVGDIVYSEYHKVVGRISRLSLHQEIEGNPSYVLSDLISNEEICFGVREHNWHYTSTHAIQYSRLIKLEFPTVQFNIETGELLQKAAA